MMARNSSAKHGYNQDFYAWVMHNAKLIRQGKFSQVDLEHVAEELESMGKSDKRELSNRLAVLLAHLLKWKFQPERRSNSWKYTIEEQRFELNELLEDSPSLNHELEIKLNLAYKKAMLLAAKEMGIDKEKFPKKSPFNLKQALKHEFFPK